MVMKCSAPWTGSRMPEGYVKSVDTVKQSDDLRTANQEEEGERSEESEGRNRTAYLEIRRRTLPKMSTPMPSRTVVVPPSETGIAGAPPLGGGGDWPITTTG